MATIEEVGRLLDNLHEQLALAEVKLAELVGRAMLNPERARQFQSRLDELKGELSLGAIDDVRLAHTSQQFLNLACEIWLEPAPVDLELDQIAEYLRLEVIRLAGEQAQIENALRDIERFLLDDHDRLHTSDMQAELDDRALLEAQLAEVKAGLDAIHQIRVRLGFVS